MWEQETFESEGDILNDLLTMAEYYTFCASKETDSCSRYNFTI